MGASPDNPAAYFRPLIDAILRAADPARALALHIDRRTPAGFVIAAGKASLAMAGEFLRGVGAARAIVVAPAGQPVPATLQSARVRVFPADHPVPTARNVAAAETVALLAREAAAAGAPLTVLLSGGASAHLTLPATGLTLDDLALVTRALMRAGAPIQDLNTVRKHCEQLKGGRLAALAGTARIRAYILSDVIGDRVDVIASGPTAPDPTTYADALAALDRHGVRGAVPAIARHLEAGARGHVPDTPKPGDPALALASNVVIASNRTAVDAAVAWAADTGIRIAAVERDVQGDAAALGTRLATAAVNDRGPTPVCRIAGSETVVPVGTASGRGGRCQEMALAAALALDGTPGVVFLAFATDGVDGPTDAAGALVTGQTCARARTLGLDPAAALANHDSHSLLARVDALIRTGPTGTNVNDVSLVVRF